MERKVLHGCSTCGGEVISHIDTLALTLDDMEVGEFEDCGAKYYPAKTSQLIDEEIQRALNVRR